MLARSFEATERGALLWEDDLLCFTIEKRLIPKSYEDVLRSSFGLMGDDKCCNNNTMRNSIMLRSVQIGIIHVNMMPDCAVASTLRDQTRR